MREGFRQLLLGVMLGSASMLVQAQSYITDKVVVGIYDQPNADATLLKAIPSGTPLEILERRDEFSQIRTPDDTTGWIENTYIIDNKPAQLIVLELTDRQRQTQRALDDARKQLLDMQEQLAVLQDKAASDKGSDSAALKKQQQANRALQQQLDKLQTELDAAQKNLADTAAQRDKLNQELDSLRSAKPEAAAQAAPVAMASTDEAVLALQASNDALQERLNAVYAALEMDAPAATTSGTAEAGGIRLDMGWLVAGILILLVGGFVAGMKTLDWLYLKRHGGFRI
jgi:SH3 domain protein